MDAPRTATDLKRLAAEVSMQHGIRIDPDDPMMAVVTLNRLVFEQAVAQVLECVQASVRDFEAAAEKVQVRAGGALAQEVRDCGVAVREEVVGRRLKSIRRDAPPSARPGKLMNTTRPESVTWLIAGLLLALALFGIGVWVGTLLR